MLRTYLRFGQIHINEMTSGKNIYYEILNFQAKILQPPHPLKAKDTKNLGKNIPDSYNRYEVKVEKPSGTKVSISFDVDENGITQNFKPFD